VVLIFCLQLSILIVLKNDVRLIALLLVGIVVGMRALTLSIDLLVPSLFVLWFVRDWLMCVGLVVDVAWPNRTKPKPGQTDQKKGCCGK
jgi:hypothetical protein